MPVPEHLTAQLAGFHLGAAVHSSDGRHVGSLSRIVVDQQSWEPHQIVVKETAWFSGHALAVAAGLPTDDLLVPFDAIARVARERIDLSLSTAQVRRLPPYLSYDLAPVAAEDLSVEVVTSVLGAVRMLAMQATADKAPTEIEIRKGESVMLGHEGHMLGEVRDVLVDGGELTGIVVRARGFFQDDQVIQVRFLERSDDGALFVRMNPADIEHLAPAPPREG
jgi:sporulation protein YlmC with PRC-barrel domain